ncbi:MAG: hypothetical protein ACREFM_25325 [Hypericibacter sp.]
MPAHAYALPAWFGLALTTAVCGSAFWKGGREEQAAAGAFLLAWVGTLIVRDPHWLGAQMGAFVIDILFLAVLTAIALRSPRYWPIAAAAFQLLAVLTHAARMADPAVRGWAYATASILWTQLVLIAMGVGVFGSWRESRHLARTAGDPTTDPGDTRR